MKKVLIATLLVLSFIVYSSDIHAQSNRSVEQIINLYDNATDWNTLNELIGSLTVEEKELLSENPRFFWLADTKIKKPDITDILFVSEEEKEKISEIIGVSVEEFELYIEQNTEQQIDDLNLNKKEYLEKQEKVFEESITEKKDPQTVREEKFPELLPETETITNGSCFDYYSFGSVDAKLFTQTNQIISGVPINFSTEITNNNPYPVVEGDLYIRVYRQQDDNVLSTVNGDNIVDQFKVLDNFSIDSGEQKEFTFSWDIPSNIKSGSYYIASYVVSSDRYNLLGLTFTDDIAGDKTFFDIVGAEDGVYFDRNSVKINNQDHQFIAYTPVYENEKEIKIEADVTNETDEDREIEVEWRLSFWDSLLEENLIEDRSSKYIIPANDTKTVKYEINNNNKSVYLASARLVDNDTTSLLNIRFAREGVNIPRINYPAVYNYPIKKNQDNTFFVCLHNAGIDNYVDDVRLISTIEDFKGNTINEFEYEGKVTGSMMGFDSNFKYKEDVSNFIITNRLYKNDILIDKDTILYNCSDINNEYCNEVSSYEKIKKYIYIFITLIFILLIFIISRKINKVKKV